MTEIDPQYLHIAYPTDHKPVDRFAIKQQNTGELVGHTAVFMIIGSSHCITVPELAYCEIVSCEPIETESIEHLPLTTDTARTVRHDLGHLTVHTDAVVRPLDVFPGPTTFDVSYRFGPQAYTTIDRPEPDTYETYHTYPERDITVYTRTELTLTDVPTETDRAATQIRQPDPLASE